MRSYWTFQAELLEGRQGGLGDSLEDLLATFPEEAREVEIEVEEEVGVVEEQVEKEGTSLITASLWWAFYVLLVFFAYVCS